MRGSIKQRSPGSWFIRYDAGVDPVTGKRQQKSITHRGTKKQAQSKLTELLALENKGIHYQSEKITMAEWLRRWMVDHVTVNTKPKTIERYRQLINTHILPRIGNVPLVKLTPGHVRDLQRALTNADMAPSGVELVHTVISGALKSAMRMELVWRNVAQGVSPPRRTRRELNLPDVPSIRRLLEAAREDRHPLHPALHLAAYCGMRRGEILGLTWADVDLKGGSIAISRSVVRSQDLGIILQPTKTDRSRRRIDIDEETVEVLQGHDVAQIENRLRTGGEYVDQGLVFADGKGAPMNPMLLTRAFQKMAKAHGLGQLRLHDLRHFHASVMLLSGESPVLVSQRLGHASIATTVDTYGHLFPGQQRAAAQRFADRMRDAT